MRTLSMLLKGFYSVEGDATIVLTKHFNLLCNDDCLPSGRAIIIVLDDW